ncbi:MAG: type III-B CRISPR-associated protein Cas10/Cmr2 [Methanothrix sp.]|nr:type III-B CRISPR-associated protein Cas10/Cmr2 [Methanothrix sp.]MCX8207738.1 type III-B CRISPR-associated protein Cas10/Cmr2 [Methanothrix sp.]
MSADEKMINFTIGPVQGFIGQARRTRDLWSGSFLLSYLSGCAMAEIRRLKGSIKVPSVKEDHLLSWIENDGKGMPPRIGTLPNRFMASADNPAVAARCAAERVKGQWKNIADCVWKKYVEDVADHGKNTQEIWRRQVDNFWEIHWSVGAMDGMEARKNWRFYREWADGRPTIEGGDHCTIMSEWQEISGYVRATDRKKQDDFWRMLRRNTGGMDLRSDERLSAIALIKRMFPSVSKDAIGWDVNADTWPSTLYVAAIPWLRSVIESDSGSANMYAEKAHLYAKHIKRKGVAEQIFNWNDQPHARNASDPFLEIDANFYYTTSLRNPRSTPLDGTPEEGDEPEDVRSRREELIGSLERLYEKYGKPSPFYAMLLMDGDSMGKLIRDRGEDVSRALASFAEDVEHVVHENLGVLVYAGGDDVLAMLPVERAMSCAYRLSVDFTRSFKAHGMDATISAGMVFASHRVPLRSVMREAHSILDDIAKDENGRGSIAVSVLKGSGRYCRWVSSWSGAVSPETSEVVLERLAKKLGEKEEHASSFFYRFRELLLMLSGEQQWRPGMFFDLSHLEGLDVEELMLAEYLNALEHRSELTEEVRTRAMGYVRDLLSVSRRNPGPEYGMETGSEICADGMLLVKFLSQKGVSE